MKSTFTLKESAKVFLLTMFLLIASIKTFAYDFAIDGIYYNVLSEENHECEVTGYKEITNSDLIIPATVTDDKNTKYTVTRINWLAFDGCSGLTSVIIPKSVTFIGAGAFQDCKNLNTAILEEGETDIALQSRCFNSIKKFIANRNIVNDGEENSPFSPELNIVELGNQLSNICNGLFAECRGLTSIKIPSSVTRIGKKAFYGCSGLSTINIPNSVTSIGSEAFRECKDQTAIIEEGETDITLQSGCFASVKKLITNRNIIVQLDDDVLPWYPFGKNLKTAEIEDKVTNICDKLFFYCSSLTSINIPESVTDIGYGAFENCSSLTSINIPKSVTCIRTETFRDCENLKSVNIPKSLTCIERWAFAGSGLQFVEIPEGITTIEQGAFKNCRSLKNISLPNSLTTIGVIRDVPYETDGVFEGCESLKAITIPSKVSQIVRNTFCDCSSLVSVLLPDDLSAIKSNAFKGCSSLASVLLPNNLSTIEECAFYGCNALKSIVIPKNVKKFAKAFSFSKVEDIKIEFGITKVPDGAFYGCQSLKNIEIPHSVTSIGDYAFRRCYSLTSIKIPSSVTSVCDSTFEETLTALNIETSKCLRVMPQLKSQIIEITFSRDYEETDVTHWDEWTKLEYLTSLSETPPMIGDSFSRFQKWNLRVMVPTSALETYKNTPVWKEFFFLKGGAETTDIENIKQDTVEANTTRNLSTYNLNGMKVYNTKPGHVYIRGGKKFVAK